VAAAVGAVEAAAVGAAAAAVAAAAVLRGAGEAMSLFDSAALARIESSVKEVEQHTAGEIVVMSVGRSDAYHEVRLAYGVACALAGAAAVHLLWPELGFGALLWIEAALIVLAWLAFNVPAVLRLLVPSARAAFAVERRARLEFLEHRVYDTREHTGVLILISELEHRVTILGDSGIYAQLKAEAFEKYVDQVIAAIRKGRAADGVCEVIADLGEHLRERLPPRPDDRNELPNAVIQEKH
jgi:putative membrane protein